MRIAVDPLCSRIGGNRSMIGKPRGRRKIRRKTMGIGKAFAIVGGLLVGAVGAYNYSTTGCPLGVGACAAERAEAVTATTTTVASTSPGQGACPLCAHADRADCDPANCDKPGCDPANCDKPGCDPANCPLADRAECPHAAEADDTVPACCAQQASKAAPAATDDG